MSEYEHSESETEDKALIDKGNEQLHNIKPERKRWYVLAAFTSMFWTQSFIWNTYGPIAESAEFAFGWSDGTIALLGNWGCITTLVTVFPFTWAMSQKGIKSSCMVSVSCMLAGGILKCISSTPHTATWLAHLGQILTNIGSPVSLAGPPVISSIWFPVHQRTTATALMLGVGGSGVSLSFIVGPLLVAGVENKTVCLNKSSMEYNLTGCPAQQVAITKMIMRYMYIECAVMGLIFLMFLLYFPTKPKQSPSITSTLSRSTFKKGMKDLIKMPMFWVLTLIYSLSGGVLTGWYTVLDIVLQPLGISQQTAGLIGFWAIALGQLLQLPAGFIADTFAKRMRLIITILMCIASGGCLVFALTCIKIIPFHIATVYATTIIVNVCQSCTIPLIYELISEISYPISEAVSNNIMQSVYTFITFVFLLIFMFPDIGTSWINWTLLGSVAVCIPLCLIIKEEYRRFDIDTAHERRKVPEPIQITI